MTSAALAILFIGNSLTSANDLPHLVQQLARSAGVPLEVASVAKPGYSLEDHWNDGEARRALARRHWDVVVLQQGPSALPESRALLVDFTRRFDREIRAAGGRTALYMVWPSAARAADFEGVSASYAAAARAIGGLLLPAGNAWRAAWTRDPNLPLQGADGFHPSRNGSVLAAMTIVRCLTGRLPRTIAVEGVFASEMAIFMKAAEDVASQDCTPGRLRSRNEGGRGDWIPR